MRLFGNMVTDSKVRQVAAIVVLQWYGSLIMLVSQVQNILGPLKISDDNLRKVSQLLLAEMKKGLGKDTNATADIKMFPTYVRAIPQGTEVGKFLALDLGGTNFRVLLIDLRGRHVKMSSKIFNVPHEVMTGTGDAVSGFCCIAVGFGSLALPGTR